MYRIHVQPIYTSHTHIHIHLHIHLHIHIHFHIHIYIYINNSNTYRRISPINNDLCILLVKITGMEFQLHLFFRSDLSTDLSVRVYICPASFFQRFSAMNLRIWNPDFEAYMLRQIRTIKIQK